MSVILTAAGQALIAQLQANSGTLVIDKFVFANIDGQDSTEAISPTVTMPTDDIVYTFDIPTEFRAFVTPNQVVYSAILGSSIGDFSFNWQGLYCSAHETLVAVATFPTMEKRANDATTNTAGNNLTRNFLLEFAGAHALTEISIDADVWQLDFSVRLAGIDERERLSNRDIYGRMAFVGDGWLLEHGSDAYAFTAGVGYVEGIRIALAEDLVAVPTDTPCDVWLDVCLEPSGADVVATVSPLYVTGDAIKNDYTSSAPYNVAHYCVKIAEIDSDGVVTDLRPKCADVIGTSLGLASKANINDHDDKMATIEVAGHARKATSAESEAGIENGAVFMSPYDVQQKLDALADDIDEDMDDKANVAMSNVSETGKATITAMGVPDYTAQIVLGALGPSAVSPSYAFDAFCVASVTIGDEENYWIQCRIESFAVVVGSRFDDHGSYTQTTSFSFFLPKGWTFSGSSGISEARVFPLQGSI